MKLGENYYGKDGINAYYRYPDVEVKMNYLQIPVKLGYNFHINDKLSLIPNVGLYAAYGFNTGESDLQMVGDGKLIHAGWKPLDGYGNTSDQAIRGFNHWDVGATAGIKAVIGKHYTISFDYNIGLNKAQSTYGLRNSTFQLSVGYRFLNFHHFRENRILDFNFLRREMLLHESVGAFLLTIFLRKTTISIPW